MTVGLHWRWSTFARRLVVVAGLALALAILRREPALAVVAAAPLAWLALAAARPEPRTATVHTRCPARCFEDEPIEVSLRVELPRPVELVRVRLRPHRGLLAEPGAGDELTRDGDRLVVAAQLRAARWGRYRIGQVVVTAFSRGRLRQATAFAEPDAEISVFPRPAPVRALPFGSTRFDRSGDHPAKSAGGGVEFHGVRAFAPGDRPRRINWPQSTRRGALYINEMRDERAVDVVVTVDVLTDDGPPGHTSRDLALRGAIGVVRAVLRRQDRVGLVALGGRLSWLRPEPGERQFYRIAEAILDVVDWESYLDPDVESIPYPALPAGAHVVFFSPLTDRRSIAAARTLRLRGHPVTVVDVCRAEPPAGTALEGLARRLWRVERRATTARLAELGIPTVEWDGDAPLDAIVAPVLRAGERAAR